MVAARAEHPPQLVPELLGFVEQRGLVDRQDASVVHHDTAGDQHGFDVGAHRVADQGAHRVVRRRQSGVVGIDDHHVRRLPTSSEPISCSQRSARAASTVAIVMASSVLKASGS